MEVFRRILEKLSRVDLREPEDLISIYKEILDEFIEEIHLISYFNVFNVAENRWFSDPKFQEDILFYSEKFKSEEVYDDWRNLREYREKRNIRSFRHYVFEKGKRKYPIIVISRKTKESELYPDLGSILFQIPFTQNGALRLVNELELYDPLDKNGFLTVFNHLESHFSKWEYIYYYMSPLKVERAATGVSIFTSDWIEKEKLLKMLPLLDLISAHLDLVLLETSLKNFSLRSAIAAIMSRNMSHNLGSHVLARIASKGSYRGMQYMGVREIVYSLCREEEAARKDTTKLVSWTKDIQFFSLYIQQRMDFIAQVSDEWPVWTEPAYFFKNLMRWFLYQRHLLNFIGASENIGAHFFHHRRHDQNLEEYDGDIRIHVFLVPEEPWLQPSDVRQRKDERKMSSLECRLEDIGEYQLNESLKLPEAPPRDWKRLIFLHTPKGNPEKMKDFGTGDYEDILLAIPGGIVGYQAFYVILENIIRNSAKHGFKKGKTDHLDLVIEIYDGPAEKVSIYNENEKKIPARLIRIYDNVSFLKSKDCPDGVSLWSEPGQEKGINDRLEASIILGGLKKEDWGLAEMKIAAGYLQRRAVTAIGAEGEAITGHKATGVENGTLDNEMLRLAELNRKDRQALIRAVESPIGTLGYEFYIPRPKTVGLVYPHWESDPVIENYNLKYRDFKQEVENLKDQSIYIRSDEEDRDFEFFVFVDPGENIKRPRFLRELYQILIENKDSNDLLFADSRNKQELEQWLGKESPEALRPLDWLKIAIERYPYRLFIAIDPEKDGWQNSEGYSPFNDEFWYKESSTENGSLPPKDNPGSKTVHREWIHSKFLYKRICWLNKKDVGRIFFAFGRLKNSEEYAFPGVKNQVGEELNKESYFKLWLYLQWLIHVSRKIRRIGEKNLRVHFHNLNSKSVTEKADPPYFADTLPEILRAKEPNVKNDQLLLDLDAGKVDIFSHFSEDFSCPIILFRRHANAFRYLDHGEWQSEYHQPENVYYGEGLSGGLSYWTGFIEAVTNLARVRSIRFIFSMIEQALLRVFVIDERVQEWYGHLNKEMAGSLIQQRLFVSFLENPEKYNQKPIPAHNLYAIISTNEQETPSHFSDEIFFKQVTSDQPIDNKQDALIIHQGILDKWQSGDKSMMKTLLDWKEKIPFLVITSGRGKPVELPRGVKFLPYSAVEACMNGSYFEKLTLVRQVYSLKIEDIE